MGWKDVTFTVTVDGKETVFPGWFVAVGNMGQYGGGLHICPEAKVDDGLLDVVTLGRASILRVAATFLRPYRGTHLIAPLPATVEIVPAAVKVLVPRNSSVFS